MNREQRILSNGTEILSDLFRNGTPAALTDSELLDRFTATPGRA